MSQKHNLRRIGCIYEELAASFLTDSGYEILERNYYTRFGELDIVAREGDTLVFVEVKYRSSGRFGEPWESITTSKMRSLIMAAGIYMTREKCYTDNIRFDLIGFFTNQKIRHIKNITLG